ncbi:MAG: 3-hydroxyacyl-ACP dehydratase FabZ [Roseovarius sp.]|nr:3-hydroxyacyl-ACP dehydratase FabZ [Roseovarius sp.]MCY4290229.1 3-hydroxyacyl-ACP dehydratase FabZ [Roseovarius sp.]
MGDSLKSADIQTIQRIIPHRYPFLYVDRVIDIDGYKSCIGIKNVTMNEPFFAGHFPGRPIMPGVAIVEAMAQTAAVMVGSEFQMHDQNIQVYFMGIDNCKFRKMVIPGDVLKMKIETVRGRPGAKIWKFNGIANVRDDLACEAGFTAMMDMPREKDA